jgi:hypothetical protein
MDERDRDKFYSPPEPAADDDEYELEPLDPAIVAAEERHAKAVAEHVRDSIDIDDVYREADRDRGAEVVENWVRNFKYQFHIKHALFATAIVAMMIAVAKLGYLGLTLTILVMGSVGGLYLYLNWQDRKHQAEAYAKREELYAKRRERLRAKGTTPAIAEPLPTIELTPPRVSSTSDKAGDMSDEEPASEPFRINFSLRSLMIALTVAVVSLGIIGLFGDPDATATILGSIAVFGLIVLALGFVPPQSVVLGWWFILVLYVVFSVAGAL